VFFFSSLLQVIYDGFVEEVVRNWCWKIVEKNSKERKKNIEKVLRKEQKKR